MVSELGCAEGVDVVASFSEVEVVLIPCFYRIVAVCTGGIENAFPEFFHSCACSELGEYLLRPLLAGNSSDAPLILVSHFILNRLHDGISLLTNFADLLLVDSLKSVRVVGDNVNHSGKGFCHVFELCLFPVLYLCESRCLCVTVCALCDGLV